MITAAHIESMRRVMHDLLERGRKVSTPSEIAAASLEVDDLCNLALKALATPIEEATVPVLDAINEPCKGCGKRPIDFMVGEGSLDGDERDA